MDRLILTALTFWSATTDLSKTYAGTLSGLMNTGGNIGGTISPTLTPWIANQFGWTWALGFAAAIAFLGAILWLGVKPGNGLKGDST